MAEKSTHLNKTLFEAYICGREQIPEKPANAIISNKNGYNEDSKESMVKDYIAGMTDRFAMLEYGRIVKSDV